jgi:GNAT superfamily N-acetyltransferase
VAILAGRLEVYEWMELQRSKQRASWYDLLDFDHDSASLAEFVSDIVEDTRGDYDMALVEGSLYLIKDLQVHPPFRGQCLGLRLMAHAIQALNRSGSDVFVCQAMPMPSMFEAQPANPGRDRESVKRLAAYYRQLGFRTWRRTKQNEPIVLWQHCSRRFVWQ